MMAASIPMNFGSRFKFDIAYFSNELAQGRISCEDLTRQAILNHETKGASLNAYKFWQPEKALAMACQADSMLAKSSKYRALQGIPISVKDIYGLSGYPIFAGSAKELPNKWRRIGPLVSTLEQQNAVFVGKTQTVEFAYGGLGVNNHWGTPKNPWEVKDHRVPGGSSSGAGVSLWEGSALAALGTDTSGSVRIPASFTGNVGLKTATGLWSTDGIVPLCPLLDTAGILTRTVADAHLVFESIQQPGDFDTVRDRVAEQRSGFHEQKFRIGIDDGLMWNTCESNIAEVCQVALQELEHDGCSLVAVDFPDAQRAVEIRDTGGLTSADLIEFLQSELPQWRGMLDPTIKQRIEIGGDISAIEYLQRKRQIEEARFNVRTRYDSVDVIAAPTVPISPPLMSEISTPDTYMSRNLLALQNTAVGSYLDLCSITVPVGLDSVGMPVGLQFMTLAGNEIPLLRIAHRLEHVVRTRQLMPEQV